MRKPKEALPWMTLRAGRSANKPITRRHILHPAQIVVGLTSSAHLNG
jgi:hypothetical protein